MEISQMFGLSCSKLSGFKGNLTMKNIIIYHLICGYRQTAAINSDF